MFMIAAVSSVASAVVTVDGTKDASYGSPLSVQQSATGFGDSNLGSTQFANGSEIDAVYAEVSGGRLNLLFTGNLETNFNKLDIFIDSAAGGMNRLTPLGTDQGNFNRMASSDGINGLTFDAGFTANRWISVTAGGATPDIFVDYANLDTGTGNYAGQSVPLSAAALTGGNGGPSFNVTFNNANSAGVTGSTAPNDAASVLTGVEVSIALADLGYTGGLINIAGFINGGGQDFLANQVMGTLPAGTGNLGEPRNVNFNTFAGNQFVTVPEPATLGAIAGAALAAFRRRK
jgi:hypothetical protein